MRILKTIALIFASLIGLAILIVGGLIAYASIDKKDAFVVRDAALADPDYLKTFDALSKDQRLPDREHFIVRAHRLTRGEGAVFGYRFYSNGSSAIDDEIYEKLTIWTKDQPPAAATTLDLSDPKQVLAIYAKGGSAWPRNGCSGYVSTGTVRITPDGAKYVVEVRGQLSPMQNIGIGKRCTAQPIDAVFRAKEIGFDELTPWLGLSADHPYKETYR